MRKQREGSVGEGYFSFLTFQLGNLKNINLDNEISKCL